MPFFQFKLWRGVRVKKDDGSFEHVPAGIMEEQGQMPEEAGDDGAQQDRREPEAITEAPAGVTKRK